MKSYMAQAIVSFVLTFVLAGVVSWTISRINEASPFMGGVYFIVYLVSFLSAIGCAIWAGRSVYKIYKLWKL